MNEHPHILLAEFVEGSLAPEARAEVEAHVDRCETCREEVALAEEARTVLAALPEVPAPTGLTFEVRRRARRPATPRMGRWVAAAAAAALLLAGGVVVVRGLVDGGGEAGTAAGGGGDGGGRGAEAASEAPESADQATREGETLLKALDVPTYSESNRDYDNADLVQLGRRFEERSKTALAGGLAPTATAFYRDFDPAAFTPQVREAIECSLREIPPEQLLVPFAIEAASFQGEPAYVAAFLQGPAPDQPYDRVVLWVVARDSCALRSLATQRL